MNATIRPAARWSRCSGGEDLGAAPEQHEVDGGVLAGEGGEAVRGHDPVVAEVGGEEVAGGGDVVDGQGHGGVGDVDEGLHL
ncbi:hypothetical protein [Streptomyces sp. NBC_01210]|uniref:hypothetical protein n=1 Tax=Streptomyces sp. NBC_01210 TaxID=2903774 RepID=UPI003FA3A932